MNTEDVDPLIEMSKLNNELNAVQRELSKKNAELIDLNEKYKKSLAEIKVLKSLIPICMWCRKIKDESNNWIELETYIKNNTDSSFSHGLCAECYAIHYPEFSNKK